VNEVEMKNVNGSERRGGVVDRVGSEEVRQSCCDVVG